MILAALLQLKLVAATTTDGDQKAEDNPAAFSHIPKELTSKFTFLETFDAEHAREGEKFGFERWRVVRDEKFTGGWEIQKRTDEIEGFIGDQGLVLQNDAAHHGAAVNFPPITGQDLTLQYEVKLQEGLSCGGAYLKIFDGDKASFSDTTPYVIMFGPDRCGSTNKVHFILKHQNPVSKEWIEHHVTYPPKARDDTKSHLYTLHVNTDNTFEILVDGEVEKSGSLLNDVTPSVVPPKMLPDSKDAKPEDWVDEETIPDTNALKPPKEEWDEDAPEFIKDLDATKPDGWNEDEKPKIPDPNAQKPKNWDDDEDGEWLAPMVDNLKCEIGCGKWSPPLKRNPEYKGKWKPPMIPNPAYKGRWKPREVENPDYFENAHPGKLPRVSGLGFELWTMQNGILFDNIIVGQSKEERHAAAVFAKQTFGKRKAMEDVFDPIRGDPSDSMFAYIWRYADFFLSQYSTLSFAVLIGLLLIIWSTTRKFLLGGKTARVDKSGQEDAGDKKKKAKGQGRTSTTSGDADEQPKKKKKAAEYASAGVLDVDDDGSNSEAEEDDVEETENEEENEGSGDKKEEKEEKERDDGDKEGEEEKNKNNVRRRKK